MGRDDSGDSFRPGGEDERGTGNDFEGGVPAKQGSDRLYFRRGEMTGGGIQPCGDGGRFVSISMRAERHRLTGAERTDFVLSALFLSEDAEKTEKSSVFGLTRGGSVIY